ncbi:MAG: hypothetical protein CMP51_05935 [Flavobacteriales bacterium]|nr:hypothetical protein [Flavobacteriales bacterium]|tara:strand:- start:857 stop:1747 length:891 start_codon:yes stop_codon:yes gene_type:complete
MKIRNFNKILHVLLLIRLPNIVIVIASLLLFQTQILKNEETNLNIEFHLFSISIFFIMCSGYIINDLLDVEIDVINSKNNYIGKTISRKNAIFLYNLCNTVVISTSLILSYLTTVYYLFLIYIFGIFVLKQYSEKYKYQLSGNLIIAILTSVPLLILIKINHLNFQNLFAGIILKYSLLVFLINFIREIIKDMDDLKGDSTKKLNNIVVNLGINNTRKLCTILLLILSGFTIYLLKYNMGEKNVTNYLNLLVVIINITIILCIYLLNQMNFKKYLRNISILLKLIMFFGVLSILII